MDLKTDIIRFKDEHDKPICEIPILEIFLFCKVPKDRVDKLKSLRIELI